MGKLIKLFFADLGGISGICPDCLDKIYTTCLDNAICNHQMHMHLSRPTRKSRQILTRGTSGGCTENAKFVPRGEHGQSRQQQAVSLDSPDVRTADIISASSERQHKAPHTPPFKYYLYIQHAKKLRV